MRASAVASVIYAICGAAAALAQEAAQPAWVGPIMKCASKHLPLLDDRVSPANVVAKAIAHQCLTEIRAAAEARAAISGTSATTLTMGLLEGDAFVADVLRYRATVPKDADSIFDQMTPDQGLQTNNRLLALCRDPRESASAICLTYLTGWLDA